MAEDRKGDVRLTVVTATVGPAPSLGTVGTGLRGKPILTVLIRLDNLSSRPVLFRGWDDSPARPGGRLAVRDTGGRAYARLPFRLPGLESAGRQQSVTAKGVSDVLAFEPPGQGVDRITLEVQGSVVGQPGAFTLHIPTSAVRRSP